MNLTLTIIACSLLFANFQLHAAALLTSTKSISIKQSIGTNKTNVSNEKINFTNIVPSYSIIYNKSKLAINAGYSLIASQDNTNKVNNISHRLRLKSDFTHIPKLWTSSYSSNISQKNISDNAQLIDDVTTSIASQSYIVNSLNTTRNFNIKKNMKLNSSLGISSQGFKGGATARNTKASLLFDVQQVLPKLNIQTSVNTNKNINTKTSNSRYNISNFYIINNTLKAILSATQNKNTNSQFNASRYTLGINWNTSPNSRINFEIGKFGDNNSWSTDTLLTLRRLSFSLKHSEDVTPVNQSILNNLNNSSSIFSDATGNEFKFVKNTTLSINHRTRRLVSSLSFSQVEQFSDLTLSSDRTNKRTSLSFSYSLNPKKSISYTYTKNKILTTVNNQLIQHSVNWSSKLNENNSYTIRLRFNKQENDLSEFNSKLNQIDFNYRLKF